MLRSILLHVADDEGLEARTQVSLDLARTFDGHLACLQAVPYEYGVPGDFYGGMLADLVPILREAADKLRERCERRLTPEDVVWSWNHEDGRALEHILRASALSDVVVVGSREPLSKGPSLLVGQLAPRMSTPMLIVPEHVNGLNCDGTAVVAWNGSAEASHALKAALPLLAKARSVLLASVTGERGREFDLPAVEGAEYLSRHGISCEMTEFPIQQSTVGEVLADVASRREAAYLVMGAYGHPRLVETVLGGVTRELFANPPLPIFTCH
jgi:nucleotide-binding universal stress UspA family protein